MNLNKLFIEHCKKNNLEINKCEFDFDKYEVVNGESEECGFKM